jgi:streptogramin lyase/cytochrome c5
MRRLNLFARLGAFGANLRFVSVAAALASLSIAFAAVYVSEPAAAQAPATRIQLPGTASLSGTVTAPVAFRAARVMIRNTDKRILYMVYTNAGRFRAVALFPGNYEISVRAPGLESTVQKLTLRPGDIPTVNLALQNAAPERVNQRETGIGSDENFAVTARDSEIYSRLYPPGPGRDVLERTCINCHGANRIAGMPARAEVWAQRIDRMMGRHLWDADATNYPYGVLSFRDASRGISRQDRQVLIDYLAEHFGPTAKPRRVRIEQEMPLDEAKLGRAMYIEYYLPEDPPGQGIHAPEFAKVTAAYSGRRVGSDPRFDQEGNVWVNDRGFPHRLTKLDPSTGQMTDYVLPDPQNGTHEVLTDPSGMIWLPEHQGAQPSQTKRLLGFNPKTEKWERQIPMDPDNVIRNPIKWMQSLAMDSKGNIYVGWIMGGALSKWERATDKVSVFPVPIIGAIPYGVVADRNDNIWVVLWNLGGVAKFDTQTNAWTIFSPPTYPGQVRRPNVDSKNNIWFGIWAAGLRPGKLAKLDQTTGRFTEYTVPMQNAEPYDVEADSQDNIWASDAGQDAAIWKFDVQDQTFTFYPKPQPAADSPKVQVTRDGSVWYTPRGSRNAPGVGALYPDMDKITTLRAFYKNGPPGYPFQRDGGETK